VACWRTKAAISLKRVKIEEKLLWTTYRNSLTLSDGTIPDPLWPPLPRDWGLELSYPLLSQEQAKLRTSNLADTFTGPIRIKKPIKNFGGKGACAYPGSAQIFGGTLYYLWNG